jgi:hypothetical protein
MSDVKNLKTKKQYYINTLLTLLYYFYLHECLPYYDTNVLDIYIVKCNIMGSVANNPVIEFLMGANMLYVFVWANEVFLFTLLLPI